LPISRIVPRREAARVADSAFIDVTGVEKSYGGLRPLRLQQLRVGAGERYVISGLDMGAAETLVNLITGASLPDKGEVVVGGQNTRAIATDTEWLASLDRFGIVTDRAILLNSLSIEANMALPMTIAIDFLADDVRAKVRALAVTVGLDPARLDQPAASLTAAERIRVHIARALAIGPLLLLLEHPSAPLSPPESGALGAALKTLSHEMSLGWVAFSEDDAFADATGGTRLRLDPATGIIQTKRWWRR
jgi:ABC-type transporter Mla maintaining outer membrane lipid asymmetry ATPase subunit MlaF